MPGMQCGDVAYVKRLAVAQRLEREFNVAFARFVQAVRSADHLREFPAAATKEIRKRCILRGQLFEKHRALPNVLIILVITRMIKTLVVANVNMF